MTKLKKYLLIIALLVFGCQLAKNAEKVREFVINQVKKEPNSTLNFNQFNFFKWNKLYIIGPYVNENLLDTTLLKYKREVAETGIRDRDDITIVMLFNNEELVAKSVFKLSEGNFSNVVRWDEKEKLSFYKRSDAIFDYTTSIEGYIKFKLHN